MCTVRAGVMITDFIALTGGQFNFFACKSKLLTLGQKEISKKEE